MKNFLFSVTTFLALSLVFSLSSCNKQETEGEAIMCQNEEAYIDLASDLVEINSQYGVMPESKGNWWRYLIVGLGDAGGFFLAGTGATGVSAGVSLSTLLWTILKPKEGKKTEAQEGVMDNPFVSKFETTIPFLPQRESSISVEGDLHNKIISVMYEKYGDNMFSFSSSKLIDIVERTTAEVMGVSLSEAKLGKEFTLEDIERAADDFMQSNSSEEFVSRLCKDYPSKASELSILKVVGNGYDQIVDLEEVTSYSLDVVTAIDNSGIPEKSKQVLKGTVSVADASCHLWDTRQIQKL